MGKLKISIITVCYNAQNQIEETINSVIKQTYQNIEYIIIDGNSTDLTLSIIYKYKSKINLIISEDDNGIYDAMNKGIKYCTGDIICFLNAGDTYLNKNSIKFIADRILPEAQVIYSDLLITDIVNGKSTHNCYKNITHFHHLFYSDGFAHCSTFYKKESFDIVGPYNPLYKIVSDLEWNFKALIEHKLKFQYIKTISSIFRTGGISNNPSFFDIWKKENIEIRKTHFKKYEYNLLSNKIFHKLIQFNIVKKTIGFVLGWKLNRIYKCIN